MSKIDISKLGQIKEKLSAWLETDFPFFLIWVKRHLRVALWQKELQYLTQIQMYWNAGMFHFMSGRHLKIVERKYKFTCNAFFVFFIKTFSSSMICASSVPFWTTAAYYYMNYQFDCLCRRNIHSNEEPGNRICPPMTLREVMMMTVINWSWWPITDKTYMGFVWRTAGQPRLA